MSSHLLGFVQELKAAGVKRITLELFGSGLNETTTGLFTLDELTTELTSSGSDKHEPDVETSKSTPSEKTEEPKKVVKQKLVAEKPIKKPAVEKSTKPEVEKPIKEEVYTFDAFCKACETDDGSDECTELRARIIKNLSHDDLLQVNNEFGLGVDTDVPVETIREEIASTF